MTKEHSGDEKVALVTGGTQGIGLACAKILAQEGYSLLLVGRDQEKTARVAGELAATYGREVTPLVADLTSPEAAQKLYTEAKQTGKIVTLLINNAGFGIAGEFVQTQLDHEIGMMRLNMETVVRLTKLFVPDMVARRGGKILNVASVAAFQPGPYMTVYSATKAFVLSFSEALSEELRGKGIVVTALCPGPTKTGFQANAQLEEVSAKEGSAADPFVVASAGIEGLLRGKSVVIPGMKNRLLIFLERFLPRRTVVAQAAKLLRGMTQKELH